MDILENVTNALQYEKAILFVGLLHSQSGANTKQPSGFQKCEIGWGVSSECLGRFLIRLYLSEGNCEMSNTTASDVKNVHGQNPQYLVVSKWSGC